MPIEIAELRLHEVEDAVAFAAEQGCNLSIAVISHTMSVLVREDDKIIGAGLCERPQQTNSGWKLHLCLSKGTTSDLAQHMSDKAMMKMHAAKLSKFGINLHGGVDTKNFWNGSTWLITTDSNENTSPDHDQANPASNDAAAA
ncbi:hypothetical protein [Poriferisphaera sp. WC338]|uniref:hypothetical protein n=1 Tax=Poriferisphaera sp. WC338 TaxID=3425129 RepID=UPI003D81A538